MATLKDTTRIMMYLGALWPREPVTEATIKAYHTVLQDLDTDALTAAAEKLGAASTFFPRAAELRQTAFDLVDSGDDSPSALEAWGQVKGSIPGRHELTDEAMKSLGGWRAWGNSNIDDEPSWRARFIQAYEILQKRRREDRRQLPQVAGYIEARRAEIVDREIKKLLGKNE